MAKKENFTAERIARFQCEPGKQQSIYWDAKTPGLGLRVTKAGAKSYIFEAWMHGKSLRVTIGDVRTWSIGKAQTEATRLKSLTDQGIDPRQQNADRVAAAEAKRTEIDRQLVTLGDAWTDYLKARKGTWGDRHYQDHANLSSQGGLKKKRGKGMTAPGPLASLVPLTLSELTSKRIAKWLDVETVARPTQAALAFRLLRGCLNWCESEKNLAGLVPTGALVAPKVRDALPENAAKDDCLQREQLPLWFEHVRQLSNPVHAAYLQTLLLTGARRRELTSVQWQDVDFRWKSITIRDKVEGERTIPLTPYVASLLSALPRRNEWIFSSPMAASGKLTEPRTGHNKALAAAGLPPLSVHGLRRSFGTLSEWCEVPTGVVAQIMGHKPSAIAEKHYRRRPLDLLRSWHVKIETWILEQAGVEFVQVHPGLRVVTSAQ
ncbi:MAG: integrase family protein [Comamonadaceae bacterium]